MNRFCATLLAIAVLAGCVKEMEAPRPAIGAQEATFTFKVNYPGGDNSTKVALDENDPTKLVWTGEETMTLVFGKYSTDEGKDNKKNATLESKEPGLFSGTIEIPAGFDIDDLHGLVVPGENGAYYDWTGSSSTCSADIRMYVNPDQVQAKNNVPEFQYMPFFYEIKDGDIVETAENTYSIKGGGNHALGIRFYQI